MYMGASLTQGDARHFYSGCGFMVGLSKPQRRAKFDVAGFIYYGNMKESIFKRQIRFLSHPLGKLVRISFISR